MKIDKIFLKALKPCEPSWKKFLRDYPNWSGTLTQFLELEKVSTEDRLWVLFQEIPELEKFQRQFAFQCASRVVDDCEIKEVVEYFNAIILIYESGELELLSSDEYRAAYWAANWAANRAANWAANRAADWAANRAANRAANWAANRAADWAADWAADRAEQLEMATSLAYEMGL
jgi:hypothetical protein